MGGKLPPFAIADTDGTPKIWQPTEIYFPNGSVTDLGNGTVFVNTGAGGGTTLSAATPVLIKANTIQIDTSGAGATTFWRGDFTWAVPAGGETLEARTPLLKAGTVLSLNTDGTITNFLRGDGTWAIPADYYNFTLSPQGAVLDDNNPPAITIIESTSTGTARFYVADFDATTDEIIYWTLSTPDDMASGNWLADVSWFTNSTANQTCVWEIAMSATTEGDADNMTEQAMASSNTASEVINTIETNRLIQTTITMSNLDNVTASDIVTLRFNRDANAVDDTLTTDARFVALRLRIPRA